MTFKLFIYYCAVLGGWAAFLVWGINQIPAIQDLTSELMKTSIIGALLGVLLGGTVGALDAQLNSSEKDRPARVATCAMIGLVGGLVAGDLGQVLANLVKLRLVMIVGWVLVGMTIGASVGVYDFLRAKAQDDTRLPVRKMVNGVLGGLIGGLIGGVCNTLLPEVFRSLEHSSKASAFIILGGSIGLFIGLAQVFLKDAWLKVESGFRTGREIMLTKDETTIGRAESCDLGMFGDNAIEKLHARINLLKHYYVVEDVGTPAGTFLNDKRLSQPTPLRDGDVVRVGASVLRFRERPKKNR